MRARTIAALSIISAMSACAPTPPPPAPSPARLASVQTLVAAEPDEVAMHAGLGVRIDSVVHAALASGAGSGVAVAVGRHGRLVHLQGYGRTADSPGAAAVTPQTLFDVASLTKVVATTTAAMLLEEHGLLQLDRPIAHYLPAFDDSAKSEITIRMLLTHRGGLEAFAPLYRTLRGRDEYLSAINERPLRSQPGTETIYSDWDMVLLQLVLERISGQTLDAFAHDRIFGPLGMRRTTFDPSSSSLQEIAATEVDPARGGLIHGEVHDPNAWALGGVAGHAGLFSTAADLSVFAQTMLNGGSYADLRLLLPQTVARWTAPQHAGASRALGWDTPSGQSSSGRYFSARSFGHTGFTGTSLWIDPERGLFVVLLTNRVHPTSRNSAHVALRRSIADLVQESILDAPLVDWESVR